MSMRLVELKQERSAILGSATSPGCMWTPELSNRYAKVTAEIADIEAKNTITKIDPVHLLGGGEGEPEAVESKFIAPRRRRVSNVAAYKAGLGAYFKSGGRIVSDALMEGFDGDGFSLDPLTPRRASAALYEGSGPAGGYAVPITVDDQVVPLAAQEMAVRQVATVIPTTMDIKFPVKASFSTATAKAETTSFTESEPTLSQFTLSAYMAGVLQEISWELAQDVPAFQAFAVDDMILAQQMYEENLYVNGTGSGQAQGLIGNTGTGYGPQEPDTNGNLVSIAGILNTIGTLNEAYHANASFLMARPTGVILRKAQMLSNLFFPAFTSVGGQDFMFGYPVNYSAYVPTAARGNTPVLFGDFKRGYIIGDRGGSGINVKVLDQPLAAQGLLQLLAYRRTDGRVRRSEAIQAYTVSAS